MLALASLAPRVLFPTPTISEEANPDTVDFNVVDATEPGSTLSNRTATITQHP